MRHSSSVLVIVFSAADASWADAETKVANTAAVRVPIRRRRGTLGAWGREVGCSADALGTCWAWCWSVRKGLGNTKAAERMLVVCSFSPFFFFLDPWRERS